MLRIQPGCRRWRWGRDFLPDGLAVIVSHHYDDVSGLFSRDDLTCSLRPFDVSTLVVADQTRFRAMPANDPDLRVSGKGILEPVGEPVRICIAHHHNLDRGILSGRGRRRAGIIWWFLPFC